jgi:hypothetical protein
VTTTLVLSFGKGTPPNKVGRSEMPKVYNTKEAQEMRLALVEDQTAL